MGKQWFKRPIQVVSTEASANAGSQTVSGTMTVTKTATFSSATKVPVETVTSTATTLQNHGVSKFGSSVAKSWRLGTPAAGVEKVLWCSAGATGAIQKVIASTSNSINFVSTGGSKNVAQFNKNNEMLRVVGFSTSQWLVCSPNAAIAYSTS